jgi:RNA polymerase sigma-70 factor (ECF subfamily)
MADSIDAGFVRLVNENLGIAHKVCRLYYSDAADREDALQEMLYQLWKSYSRFNGQSKFSTWMYSVCLNTALTQRRKKGIIQNESLSLRHLEIAEQDSDPREVNNALLLDAIAQLSPVNKAIVMLYLEEMSYEDIAAITGITRTNVSVRLVRIKKELETHLKKQL